MYSGFSCVKILLLGVLSLAHSRKKLDLLHQRYGRLEVISAAKNVGNRTAWLCRCDCGKEIVVTTGALRSGRKTSCGCETRASDGGLSSLHYIEGTCLEMLEVGTVRRTNTSGVPGVDWLKGRHRWRASIGFQGRRWFLGSFATFEEAVAARKEAEARIYAPFLEKHRKQDMK